MTLPRTWMLLSALGLCGCWHLPHRNEETKQKPLAPIAAAPTAITASYVKRDNAHEVSQALNDEIEQDLREPVGFTAVSAKTK